MWLICGRNCRPGSHPRAAGALSGTGCASIFISAPAAIRLLEVRAGISWNFHDVKEWTNISITCSLGQNQSPVNLQSHVIGDNHGKKALEFLNYGKGAQQLEIRNTGHTVQLSGTWGRRKPSIRGAIFSREIYTISNVHLHWSTADNNGTEHAIEGRKYAAELHLVHFNEKYQNVSEASLHPDGIAVVGILYRVNDNVSPNPGMAQFAALAQQVLSVNASVRVATFNLASFILQPLPPVYSYYGSLTTPPCTENVRWAILSEPQPISSTIIRLLRNVILSDGDTHNIRPLQPINNRLIEFYSH
ncbi:carbonic anhydrase 2-like [Phymastichus coffea]|uniref:carbonic anhydrase 2-like n=1 Tax=Phymastichus coffea TaxID=108790 RepID=UPI00273BFBBE|nr:carbonic anhydrase 2-like [Phymastichus coffea]